MRILLAEDERPLARSLVKIFEKNFFTVDAVENGEDALAYLESGQYDVAVLDIMMPKADGITVLRRLRAAGNAIPVLLLTAKSEVDDKVQGLDSGANYYLTKPFDTKELLATLRAITRSRTSGDSRLTFGSVTLDRSTFTLSSPSGSFRLANQGVPDVRAADGQSAPCDPDRAVSGKDLGLRQRRGDHRRLGIRLLPAQKAGRPARRHSD